MEPNVGGNDRLLRLGVGGILTFFGVALALTAVNVPVGVLLAVAGGVGVVTGAMQRCPANELLGIDTCERSRTR